MKQSRFWLLLIMATMLATACSNEPSKEQSAKAERMIETAHKARDYNRLMTLTDSLENLGYLSQAEAYYWKGYASDRMKKTRMAEFYWKTALEATENSTKKEDLDTYAKTASRLANLLSVKGDYEGTLKIGVPAAQRLEELKCDTTSDYVNLLIYIGCCQAGAGNGDSDAEEIFKRAYQKHKDNISKAHSDAAYKDAIAGLTNIAYFCNQTKNYKAALNWTEHFGEMLNEYEQHSDVNAEYIDKQLARFDIYQAIALEGLGKKEEAAKVYEAFKATEFSKAPEGKINGNNYLVAAGRWDEAADNYSSLDAILSQKESSLSIDDIQELMLKKYLANLRAGRRDTAAAVGMQICDSLNHALALAKQLDAEEQATMVGDVELLTSQQAEKARKKQLGLFGTLALLFLGFIAYIFYSRRADRQLRRDHQELQKNFATLKDATTTSEREATELRVAHSLAETCPTVAPTLPKGFSLYASTIPTKGFGCSICDYLTRDGKLFFCVGDVEGQNVNASVAAAMIKAQFRTASAIETDPSHIVEVISKARQWAESVNLFVGVLDTETGKLNYYNAGHEEPVLLNNEITRLPALEQEMQMEKGMMIFLFNKGLLTAENKANKQYGENRLLGAALQAMKLDPRPEPFIAGITDNINTFIGDTELQADIAMLAIKC
ncbi:MAG: SpoIIE family protein phosphatase [Prevotella sp.]|nr:SpoIIE family protein phosphatase [Prevotella sp.]